MYTSNYMFAFFLGGGGGNVIEFHIHFKLHDFRGASLENVLKILCTHQITCFFGGRVTGKM